MRSIFNRCVNRTCGFQWRGLSPWLQSIAVTLPIFFLFILLLFWVGLITKDNSHLWIFGFFTIWLAYLGYHLNRAKVNLDLFEKRYPLYMDCSEALSILIQDGCLDYNRSLALLGGKNLHQAQFLFGKEIVDFMNSIHRDAMHLNYINQKLNGLPVGPERTELAEQQYNISTSFEGRLSILPKLYGKYLSFHWLH